MNKAFFFLISILLPSVISCAEEPSADPRSPEKFTPLDLLHLKHKLDDIPEVHRNAQDQALLQIVRIYLQLEKNSILLKSVGCDALRIFYDYCSDISPKVMTKLLNSLDKDHVTGLLEVKYERVYDYSKEHIDIQTLNNAQNNLKDKKCESCKILSDFVQAQLVLLKEVPEKKRLHELEKITQTRKEIDALLNK